MLPITIHDKRFGIHDNDEPLKITRSNKKAIIITINYKMTVSNERCLIYDNSNDKRYKIMIKKKYRYPISDNDELTM